MTADAPALPNRLFSLPTLSLQAVVTVLLAGWADWLFFGHDAGISFAVFIAVLALAVVLASCSRIAKPRMLTASFVLAVALLPSIENLSYLSAFLAITGIVSFVLIVHQQASSGLISWLSAASAFVLRLPFRLPFDSMSFFKVARRRKVAINQHVSLTVWIVPIAFSLIFLAMFSNANPLIERWLTGIDLSELTEKFDGYRVIFWCAAILVCWPFIRFKPARKWFNLSASPSDYITKSERPDRDLFGEPAIFRSLLLFNLLFGFQIALDATYLLGGADLPNGMSYAQYAHRGAYTLICTALLAAGFVLFAARPGSRSGSSLPVRHLILGWTVQNVLLVAFSIQRLGLYIEAYSLTYWRIAAFTWMALVLIGLVLIVAKFALRRSNKWLVEMNIAALLCVLYVVSLVNVPSLIAGYNVAAAGPGKPDVDFRYLLNLGPEVAPTLDRVVADYERFGLSRTIGGQIPSANYLVRRRNIMAKQVASDARRWRLWSFRRYRLQRYLDTAGLTRLPSRASNNAP